MKSTGVCSQDMISRNTNDPSTSIVLGTLGCFFWSAQVDSLYQKKCQISWALPKWVFHSTLNGCSWQISPGVIHEIDCIPPKWVLHSISWPPALNSTNPQKTRHHFSYHKNLAGDFPWNTGCFKKGIIISWFIIIPIYLGSILRSNIWSPRISGT